MECQERYINIITSYIVAEYVNEQDVVKSDPPVPPSLFLPSQNPLVIQFPLPQKDSLVDLASESLNFLDYPAFESLNPASESLNDPASESLDPASKSLDDLSSLDSPTLNNQLSPVVMHPNLIQSADK